MCKKITLLGVLVALFCAIPAQAQTMARKATAGRVIATKKPDMKAVKAADFAKMRATEAQKTKVQGKADVKGKGKTTEQTKQQRVSKPQTRPKAPRRAGEAEGEVPSEWGGIYQPAKGDASLYERSGTSYYVEYGDRLTGSQAGGLEMVECSDGTIYVNNIISAYPANTWVKGTKTGNTITIPTGQIIDYDYNYTTTVSLHWGVMKTDGTVVAADDYADAFTFVIDGETITLQGSSAFDGSSDAYFMGLFYDDVNAYTGVGDAETQWKKVHIVTHVDELPYFTDFSATADQYSYTVIDANGDDCTWNFVTNTDGDWFARYTYSPDNNADDWLMSPAIRLEAGKAYRMSFDTRNRGDDERIEVLTGMEKTPEAMTQQVIAPTDVLWQDNKTLKSDLFQVETSGYYYFGIHAISDANHYFAYADNIRVEELDTRAPQAVADLTATAVPDVLEASITLTAPSTNISGEALTGTMSIDLTRDGNVIHTFTDVAPGATLTYTDNASDLTIGRHTYQVIAHNDYGNSEPSQEVTVFMSATLDVPYSADLTGEADFSAFNVIDANGDGSTWGYEDYYRTCYAYSSDNAADDYLVAPPIRLTAGKYYNLTVNALTTGYDERFEVVIGKEGTPESMNTIIIEPTVVNETDDAGHDYEATFTVAEDGVYYIAVHAISDADMDHLTLNRFAIDFGPEATAPAAPLITAVAGENGAREAIITVTAPTTAVDGSTLTANVTRIEILRDGEMVGEVTDVTPGATATYTDNTGVSGTYTYIAIPYNADGSGLKSEPTTIYVGVDAPMPVQNLIAIDHQNSVTLKWDKVGTTGINGGYVVPSEVEYLIWNVTVEEGWFGPQLVMNEVIGTVTDGDTFDIPYDDTDQGDQQYEYWVVETKNEGGDNNNTTTGLLVGKPYDLPLEEGFADNSTHYFWDTNATMMGATEASDGDGSAVALLATEAGEVYLNSGKLNLKGIAKPTLTFDVIGFGISQVNIYGITDGLEQTLIQTANINSDGYTTVQVPLNTLQGARYSQISITAEFVNPSVINFFGEIETYGDALFIDNIHIMDFMADNLSLAVQGPMQITAGESGTITAIVKNYGENAAQGYTVTITADDQPLLQQTVSEPLAILAMKTFDATLNTTVFDAGKDINIKVQVDYAADMDTSDNSAEAAISIVPSEALAPATLTATDQEGGVQLTWTAPAGEPQEVTEDFEKGMGGWTSIDADGDGNVWMRHQNGGEGTVMNTNSGDGVAYSESYRNGVGAFTPDNWLVSPLAKLDGTFTFWVAGQDETYYNEHFAVYVSTESATDPATFTQVSEEFVATHDFTLYEVDLSAYAGAEGYIAIRHFNVSDQYTILLDDITYTRMPVQPTAYNIYFDGEQVAQVSGDTTTTALTDSQVADGEHTFAVTAVYADGSESQPATAAITVVTAIEQITTDAQPVDIYTLDGKLVRRQARNLDGLKGVYVVKGQKIMVK